MTETRTEALVVGAGLGGIAAALALLRTGHQVILTEPFRWIGGQLTSQLVPLDEHRRIEETGANASYRRFRDGVRDHYRTYYPLTEAARADPHLNPGAAWVSPVCHEPRAGLAVLEAMLAPYQGSGQLRLLLEHTPVAVASEGDRVGPVTLRSAEGHEVVVHADYVLDATELGDLLDLGGVEHVMGRESAAETGEPNAAATADPTDMQSVTWCFAVDHLAGENHTIDRPAEYDFFRTWQPEPWEGRRILDFNGPEEEVGPRRRYKLHPNPDDDPFAIDTDHRNIPVDPELWTYRRIAARKQFLPGAYASDVTVVNWPMNDYTGGPIFGVPDAAEHMHKAKELSRSLLFWLQTEAPRPDGGTGWPGLRLRGDVAGTADGFAMMPYIRESRRIRAQYTIVEQDLSVEVRGDRGAVSYPDSVGVGHYFWMDRHATTGGRPGRASLPQPFEIPLRALLPVRVRNLLPACKNIGTTQVTNGCYRLHPVEWGIGEAAGALAAFCLDRGVEPQQVGESPALVAELQGQMEKEGMQLRWPAGSLW